MWTRAWAPAQVDDGDAVLSMALRSLRFFSADPAQGWSQQWLELMGPYQAITKLLAAEHLTICLDHYEEDPDRSGMRRVVGFERPLLDRVSLVMRIQGTLERRPNFHRGGPNQRAESEVADTVMMDSDAFMTSYEASVAGGAAYGLRSPSPEKRRSRPMVGEGGYGGLGRGGW